MALQPTMDNCKDVVIDMGDDSQVMIPTRTTTTRFRPLPRTSDTRIAQAAPKICPDGPVLASEFNTEPPSEKRAATVLYLAYGSNMAAATFQGTRGIRPVSAVPVSVPTLRLTFDLPGLPYREPCFANTAVRKLPKVPKPPDVPDFPLPVPQPPSTGPIRPPPRMLQNGRRPIWSGPLYGVVYEVTAADYARVIATEGGGASYQEVVVACVAEPPRMGVPERPIRPPEVFLARTLWAPQLPADEVDEVDEVGGKEDDNAAAATATAAAADDDDDRSWFRKKWDAAIAALIRFSTARMRPDPDYAQPSARYLGLLTAGAAEHELPDAYQAWLASLAPYRRTHWRQQLGALLMLVLLVVPALMLAASRLTKLDSGRLPAWARVAMGAATHGMWVVYDHVLRPVFGDGEHTDEGEEDTGPGQWVAHQDKAVSI